MEQINYEQLLPAQPAEDVVPFALEQGAFSRNYLIYRSDRVYELLEDRMKDAVKVICSTCGEHFHAEKIKADGCHHSYAPAPFGWRNWNPNDIIISGQHTLCPLCGAEADTVHVSGMRLYSGELVDDDYVTILSRLPVEGRTDRLVVTDWCIRRCIDKDGRTRYEIWPYTAFVVEERKIVRLMGYAKNIGGAISLFGKWKQRKTFANRCGGTGMVMPWKPSLLNGTTAENSKLDLYIAAGGKQLAAYLALWRKCPAVENLLVQGCGKLVKAWIESEVESYLYGGGIPKLTAAIRAKI